MSLLSSHRDLHPHSPGIAGYLKGMTTCGVFSQVLYFWHYSLWNMFYPCLIQLTLMVYLISLSLRFDGVFEGKRGSATIVGGGVGESS